MSDTAKRPAVRGCVAVAVVEGSDLTTGVGQHFGRSPRFLLVRGAAETVQVLENIHAEAVQGAGPATASLLARHGVTAVIAGRFGPKAEDALRAAGVLPVVAEPGTKAEAALAGLQPQMIAGVG
jgi:predicted Fe-Mo cluster-binding NifX family protein